MRKIKLKLRAKTLWIPVTIIIINYLIIGVLFSKMIISHSDMTLNHELSKLIETERNKVFTGLSLITSTQAPADAFLGLEGDDDEMAKDVVSQVSSMGLDMVYFTDLKGKAIFPAESKLPEMFQSRLAERSIAQGDMEVYYHAQSMYTYAPVMDVETPMGYLVFEIVVPSELESVVLSSLQGMSNAAGKESISKVSVYLKNFFDMANVKSKEFLHEMLITLSVVLIATLVFVAVGLHITSLNIIKPLNQLLRAFKKQAQGDLTEKVYAKSDDEIGELASTYNQTSARLNEMMRNVSDHSQSLAASSGQLSQTSKTIADNAAVQADKTRGAATALEQLNTSFLDVASNTTDVADSAREVNDLAFQSADVITGTVASINKISDSIKESSANIEELGNSSQQIGEIVKVIDDIAGQTNLLALNAAIEAARAGDQGRGFAVVADEVRKLAEKTSSSTNEIADMVKRIQANTNMTVDSLQLWTTEVEAGLEKANEAGNALQMIVVSVNDVTDKVQRIASSVEEQSSTGSDITGNIESVADLTSQTAESVQSSSVSTENLNELAQQLRDMVGEFKLYSSENDSQAADGSPAYTESDDSCSLQS